MVIVLLLLPFLATTSSAVHERTIYINESSDANNSMTCGTLSAPCSTFDLGLEVAQYVLSQNPNTSITLLLAEGGYEHNSDTNGKFNYVNNLSIIGQTAGDDILTSILCNASCGFSFIDSYNIEIYGIAFVGCEQVQNSTGYYDSEDMSFSLFHVGLYFLYCFNVNLTRITVNDSSATGIVLYNIVGTNIIDSIKVTNNKFDDSMPGGGGGGGMYIEYTYCVPGDQTGIDCLEYGSPNVKPEYTNGGTFHITNSLFEDNVVNITGFNNYTFILPHKQYHLAFGRGGGLSVFFKGNASNNHVFIDNCNFRENHAVWGGGMFLEFQDTSNHNTISVSSSVVKNNWLYYNDIRNEGTGGGGARVDYVYFDKLSSYGNNITFESCSFTNNRAYYGGGISFYSAVQLTNLSLLNTFRLRDCHFDDNIGRIGSGLDISIWETFVNGQHPITSISDCTFVNNTAIKEANGRGLVGIGAVYIDSLPVFFMGNVIFSNNSGSALVVTGAYITIESNANVTFCGNTGRNGGAIALFGNTFILTYENSNLVFINNTAQYQGGAIYFYSSGERDLLSSRNCFIRVDNITAHPQDWTSSFYFENNTIEQKNDSGKNQPNSIYASSLLSCIWGGAFGKYSYNISRSEAFCWNSHSWIYKESHSAAPSCKGQISSAPTSFSNEEFTFSTLPGKALNIKEVSMFTDLEQNVSGNSILIARILDGPATFHGIKNFKVDYISHRFLYIYGQPNSNITIQLETLDPIVVQDKIFVQLINCPPGFSNANNDSDTFNCSCYDTHDTPSYNDYIRCDGANFTSRILRTAWFGSYKGQFVVGLSPYVQLNSSERYILLNESEDDINNFFCDSLKREGTLCGLCQNNTGVSLHSASSFRCVECHNYSWIIYLLVTYVPITIFFALIFIFSMTVTFGPLNSFLFFSQVITTTVKIDADGMIPLQSIVDYSTLKELFIIPYDIWNMNFFRVLLESICINTNMNTLEVMLLSYCEAFYPLLLLLVIIPLMVMYNKGIMCVVRIFRPFHYCLARFRQWTNLRQSVTGGIAVFIIITYTKFTLISLLLITPATLYNHKNQVVDIVHYYDGTIHYMSPKYAVPAFAVLFTFGLVLPLLLIYPSVLKLLEQLTCSKLKLTKLYPPLSLKIFLDEFHGCYKDGSAKTLDCRWFAGLYFLLRVVLFILYTFVPTWEFQYVLQILLFVFMVFLLNLTRPYKDDWINTVDILIFLILIVISLLSLQNLMLTWIDQDLSKFAFSLQYILIFIPLFYCIGYYFMFFCTKNKSPCARCLNRQNNNTIQADVVDENDWRYSNALVDSTHVPDVLEYIDAHNDGRRTAITSRSRARLEVNETSPLLLN